MYLCVSIFLVFILWIFYNYRKNGILNETKYLQQCPYCTHIFFNYASEVTPATQNVTENKAEVLEEKSISSETPGGENPNSLKSSALVCPKCNSYIDL